MKRLLQINPVVKENTSTGKIMRTLGELAQAAGWESYVAYSRARDGVPPHSSRLLPVGGKLDLVLHFLATRLLDAHGLASRLATRRFVARLRELDPDVVHIHNVHGYFLNYKILSRALAQMGKPVVWTVHDCWLYTGHCYHYASAGCERWKTGCHHCPQKKAFPASWLLDRSRRNWEDKREAFCSIPGLTLVTVSQWMKGEIAQSFLGRVRCEVIHNGINLNTFRPSPSAAIATEYGTYYLAVASIWLPEKGLKDLEKLSSLLEADERLVVVGKRPSGHRFPRNVVCVERTSDASALAALYTEAVALVNPTWQDNYPTVNLEAIACGTPVVTYRTGGSPESITPRTGRVVEQGDVEGLLEALHAIRGQGKEQFTEACRSYALAHFRAQDRFNDYIQLYESLTTG
ncbi:MAG: glycosyltransferase [Bacteroidales bacterium]|nr:glycosyltransferase [Bacteroidales bacterium]MBQ9194988.1 glycosyltransferase [Bacteroidales bacterium]